MNPVRPLIFWIVTGALIVTAAVLLRQVLLPFVAGMALAYLLDPLVNKLEQIGMKRAAATLFILASFFVGVFALLLLAIPIVGAEVASLIDNFPAYLKRLQAFTGDPRHAWVRKIIGVGMSEAAQSRGALTSVGAGWLTEFLRSLWSDGRMLISIVSLLIVTPIVTAYLVYDWNRIIAAIDGSIPPAHRDTIRALAREIDDTIVSFVRGQGTISLILGVFYALALRSIGLNHGLLIGIVSGLLGFVPYLGSLTGLLLSVSVAIAQFGLTWTPILIVLAIFFVGQSLADYALAPVFVGSKVHLNPVWLMLALFAFGYVFGFIGLLIAVPLAASIGVLVRFAVRRTRANSNGSNSTECRGDVDLSKTSDGQPF